MYQVLWSTLWMVKKLPLPCSYYKSNLPIPQYDNFILKICAHCTSVIYLFLLYMLVVGRSNQLVNVLDIWLASIHHCYINLLTVKLEYLLLSIEPRTSVHLFALLHHIRVVKWNYQNKCPLRLQIHISKNLAN